MREDDMLRLGLHCARLAAQGEDFQPALAAGTEMIMRCDAGAVVATFRLGRTGVADADSIHFVVAGAPPVDNAYGAGAIAVSTRHPSFIVDHWRSAPTSRVSDFVSPSRFWDTDTWVQTHGRFEARFPASTNLGFHGGTATFLGVQRRRTDFDDIDMAVLDLIRGPLVPALGFRQAWDTAARRLQQSGPIEHPLTRRESQVIALVAQGWTNRRIARSLTISERTVRKHLENISAKWGVSSRAAAVHRLSTPSPR